MAGLIRREDIDEVRARTRIEDIVAGYVSLRPGGVDSQQGLCPFHDEKTPSFHVRPSVGRWHCFGCGEGGDAFSFVEKIEHITFVEAVELLARKAGVELHYEGGQDRKGPAGPNRARLIDAHRVAIDFYQKALHTPQAEAGRAMLADRGFDSDAVEHYSIGYSLDSWDGVLKELREHGFSEKEIAASGLATQGNRGLYDRFRGRLMWPIFSITGDPIGFGARKLNDDDKGPKYLNTPETPIYKKSQVLYGLNLARKAIATEKRIVVVEGYTDVMAAQLAGIECAVATCGTAFGTEHVKIVRRLLGDGANPAAGLMLSSGRAYGGEVIFTFDGDAAGQKAALKAFQEDQSFAAQTFVAVAQEGMDPCEVRMAYGDEGVRQIIDGRRPLFEFAITSTLKGIPLETAEGRTAGLRAAAPMVASIRDRVLRGEYTRQLAGWLGMDESTVRAAVGGAARQPHQTPYAEPAMDQSVEKPAMLAPLRVVRDPVERIEREALEIFLQLPGYAAQAGMDDLPSQTFTVPMHRRVHEAIRAAGGTRCFTDRVRYLNSRGIEGSAADRDAAGWYVEQVAEQADSVVAPIITQLSVDDLPESRPDRLANYVWSISVTLIKQGITRQIADLRSELQRTSSSDNGYGELFARLMELEAQRRACEEQLG